LPIDALFCHRCGKPQRELPNVHETEAPEPHDESVQPDAPAPALVASEPSFPSEINFSNKGAVRICLACAVAASVLSSLPLGMLSVFWLLLTGLFYWLIAMIVFALKMVSLAGQGGLGALLREQMQASAGRDDASMQEALRILESPQGLAMMIVFVLFFAFLFFTALPAIGGLLGSKVIEKEN
jgi:hypothetical protein